MKNQEPRIETKNIDLQKMIGLFSYLSTEIAAKERTTNSDTINCEAIRKSPRETTLKLTGTGFSLEMTINYPKVITL